MNIFFSSIKLLPPKAFLYNKKLVLSPFPLLLLAVGRFRERRGPLPLWHNLWTSLVEPARERHTFPVVEGSWRSFIYWNTFQLRLPVSPFTLLLSFPSSSPYNPHDEYNNYDRTNYTQAPHTITSLKPSLPILIPSAVRPSLDHINSYCKWPANNRVKSKIWNHPLITGD